jgi:hypothetical protein
VNHTYEMTLPRCTTLFRRLNGESIEVEFDALPIRVSYSKSQHSTAPFSFSDFSIDCVYAREPILGSVQTDVALKIQAGAENQPIHTAVEVVSHRP